MKWGFIDKTGTEVISCNYYEVKMSHEGLAGVCENGKWGFIDKTGNKVISCNYDKVEDFHEGLARVCEYGKWGFIDKTGKLLNCYAVTSIDEPIATEEFTRIIKLVESKQPTFSYDLIVDGEIFNFGSLNERNEFKKCIPQNKKIKEKINILEKHRYDSVGGFYEGLACVKLNDKWGFINKTGTEVISCKYDDVYDFREGLACVKLNGKYGFIDKTGTEVISCNYDEVKMSHEGLVGVCEYGKWGFIDKTGKLLNCYAVTSIDEPIAIEEFTKIIKLLESKEITISYDLIVDGEIFNFGSLNERNEFKKCIPQNKKIKEKINILEKHRYDSVGGFYEGLARVKLNDKWGFINKIGTEVISCKYDDAYDFREGLARVLKDGKWGFIDKNGLLLNSKEIQIIDEPITTEDFEKIIKLALSKEIAIVHDLIVDGEVITFNSLEERNEYKKNIMNENQEKPKTYVKK